MKKMRLFLLALFVGGAVTLGTTSIHASDVISKDVLTEDSYCHAKFESIREQTLASAQPELKDVDDIVDFYGPCGTDPLGKDEIQAQKIEAQHRFAVDYED
jgi:hypothetical protein